MQVEVHEKENLEEAHVVIYCWEINEKIRKVENFIKQLSVVINPVSDVRICRISADDILYIESVDRRTFFYTPEKIYESKEPLYQLENYLHGTGITRISKNCLLNIDSLKSIAPLTNHQFEATLVNGEKVLVSRNYIAKYLYELYFGNFDYFHRQYYKWNTRAYGAWGRCKG